MAGRVEGLHVVDDRHAEAARPTATRATAAPSGRPRPPARARAGGHLVQQRLQVVVAVAADGDHQDPDRSLRRRARRSSRRTGPRARAGRVSPTARVARSTTSVRSSNGAEVDAGARRRARGCAAWSSRAVPVGSNRRTTARRPSSLIFIAGICTTSSERIAPGSAAVPAARRERDQRHRRLVLRGRLAVDGVEARRGRPGVEPEPEDVLALVDARLDAVLPDDRRHVVDRMAGVGRRAQAATGGVRRRRSRSRRWRR